MDAKQTPDRNLALELVHQKDPALRLAVRRAYADFNARRRNRDSPEQGSHLFMHRTPRQLMDHGVEPVQVFRFPGGSSKNAADMRLAVDALPLPSLAGDDGEPKRILDALERCEWNRSRAAVLLHWSRMTLYRKMKHWHIGA